MVLCCCLEIEKEIVEIEIYNQCSVSYVENRLKSVLISLNVYGSIMVAQTIHLVLLRNKYSEKNAIPLAKSLDEFNNKSI